MKKSFVVSLLATTALLGVWGCASDNSGQKTDQAKQPEPAKEAKDDRPMDQRLTVGMTKDDIRKQFGDPQNTSMSSDGTEIWTYSDHAKAFIPHYSLFGGKFHYTMVTFDKDNKVKSWNTTTTSPY